MILEFSATNFKSIKDKITISLICKNEKDETSYNNIFKFGKLNVSKVEVLYGMNASGKSAIIEAMANLQSLFLPTTTRLPFNPFKLDDNSIHSPTSFEVTFTSSNSLECPIYKYSISYNSEAILFEELIKYESRRPAEIYKRFLNNGLSKVSVSAKYNKNNLLSYINGSIPNNSPYLKLFLNIPIAEFSEPLKFFTAQLSNISPEITRREIFVPGNQYIDDPELKKFVINFLKSADFNVDDYDIEKQILQIPSPTNLSLKTEVNTLYLHHYGEDVKGKIPLNQESLGTKKMLILAEYIYLSLSKPTVLIIDELESSLHPELTKLIITCFLDETINKYNSQIILTSFETTLLSLDFLRKDQIIFCYKDKKTCKTYIKYLKEFSPRKTDNIEKFYIAGRYDTNPDVDVERITE